MVLSTKANSKEEPSQALQKEVEGESEAMPSQEDTAKEEGRHLGVSSFRDPPKMVGFSFLVSIFQPTPKSVPGVSLTLKKWLVITEDNRVIDPFLFRVRGRLQVPS